MVKCVWASVWDTLKNCERIRGINLFFYSMPLILHDPRVFKSKTVFKCFFFPNGNEFQVKCIYICHRCIAAEIYICGLSYSIQISWIQVFFFKVTWYWNWIQFKLFVLKFCTCRWKFCVAEQNSKKIQI